MAFRNWRMPPLSRSQTPPRALYALNWPEITPGAPPKQGGGIQALAHSIRWCQANEVAKASLLPGVPPVPPFLHLDDFQFGEKWIFTKILHTAGVLAFFGDLGGCQKIVKTKEIHQKITGRERRSSGTVFGTFLDHLFTIFKAQNTVKYSVFAIIVLKYNNVKCCKNTINTDDFEGPCAENTVNTVVFGATCRKPRTYRVFSAFWLKSIGIYGVFWFPSAENCVNSMVLERFGTSGKQKLLVFNAWKTLFFCSVFTRFFLVILSLLK